MLRSNIGINEQKSPVGEVCVKIEKAHNDDSTTSKKEVNLRELQHVSASWKTEK